MTVASVSLKPISQLEQLFNSLSSLALTATESTNETFRRVFVKKKDENGNIKVYDREKKVVDPLTGRETTVVNEIDTLSYIEDVKTGEFYWDEPDYVVAVKCALIALGMPFYVVGHLCSQLLHTVVRATIVAFETLTKMLQALALGRLFEASVALRQGAIQIGEASVTMIFEIVKAPLFALGCEIAAIYGVFRPYHARKYEAMIEQAWQRGSSYKKDIRTFRPNLNTDCCTDCKKESGPAFYFAQCFQVRGNTNDPSVVVVKRENL